MQQTNEVSITKRTNAWTLETLLSFLETAPEGLENCTIRRINGVNPTILVEMNDIGDLPVHIAVSEHQIIVESVLFEVDQVRDEAEFSRMVLSSRHLFPLSAVAIETIGEKRYFVMYGALSVNSLGDEIVEEIVTLGHNVIEAAESFEELLTTTEEQ